ncbi:MAG: alpha/beta hydrolase [Pseudoclavibacter sp.]|nr:alpha/beta hydrolase [Pseudoclavibacter sp.]
MVSWSDVQQWNSDAPYTAMEEFRDRQQRAKDLADRLYIAGYRFQAEGATADAIRAWLSFETRCMEDLVDQYKELMLACADACDNVGRVQGLVQECYECAEIERLLIAEDGTVTISPERRAEYESVAWNALNEQELNSLLNLQIAAAQAQQKLTDSIQDLLRFAQEADLAFRDRLNAVAAAQLDNSTGYDAASQSPPPPPDPNWSEEEVAIWWSTFTPQEQQQLIETYPDVIGNTDGIDATSRDHANRIYLGNLIQENNAEIQQLEELGDPSIDSHRREQLALARARQQDLEAAWTAAHASGDRQLLVVDASGPQTRIAIASGNVDTADYVATYVPGMGTTARDDLEGSMNNMENVRDAAHYEQGVAKDRVAVITWIGYDAPPGVPDAASPDRAQAGAPVLNDFLEGVHASRQQSEAGDPYMTVLAHSYGSTTAGTALDDIDPGVVDDVVVYGSPGAGVDNAYEYNIDGTAYVSAIPSHDEVQGVGPDHSHGVNPATGGGFTHISNEGTAVNNFLDPYDRHDDYPYTYPDGTVTPILIDMSDIVVGGRKDPGEEA